MKNYQLEKIINKKLNSSLITDVIPNGLQIEGCENIKKVIVGVSVCQKLIDIAIEKKADAIIVHHGFFWKNESRKIINNQKNRIKSILLNNINLYTWHLPLDIHPTLGNNVQIAKKLNITILGKITNCVLWGNFYNCITVYDLFKKIELVFKQKPICFYNRWDQKINSIAWCSGKGQELIKHIVNLKVDAFLTGESSENTMHYALENNINFFAAGHYSTEKFGIKALKNWLIQKYSLDVEFIDINNPV